MKIEFRLVVDFLDGLKATLMVQRIIKASGWIRLKTKGHVCPIHIKSSDIFQVCEGLRYAVKMRSRL